MTRSKLLQTHSVLDNTQPHLFFAALRLSVSTPLHVVHPVHTSSLKATTNKRRETANITPLKCSKNKIKTKNYCVEQLLVFNSQRWRAPQLERDIRGHSKRAPWNSVP